MDWREMIKYIIVILTLVIVLTSGAITESYAGEVRDVTILGITLGKSLGNVGIRKCEFKEDSDCYIKDEHGTGEYCFTQVRKNLSFDMSIYVTTFVECDITSPIENIDASFDSDDYGKVLSLLISKFGRPHKTKDSVVQNRLGAKYQKIENEWTVRRHWIYLTNRYKIDEGRLRVLHPDELRREQEKSSKDTKSDRDKF
jgi:hypothetical protein